MSADQDAFISYLEKRLREQDDRACRAEATVAILNQALKHWRSEYDRASGAIHRLEVEVQQRNQRIDTLQLSLLEEIQDANAVNKLKESESKRRGKLWKRINELEAKLSWCRHKDQEWQSNAPKIGKWGEATAPPTENR